jgi:hypothetical protein
MLLMMVPMVELEERDTGEFTSALEATPVGGGQRSVDIARAEITSSQPVDTGMPFTYKLFYTLSSAPVYNRAMANPCPPIPVMINVTIEVVAPDGIKLVDNSGNLIANPGETRTIVLGGGSLMAAGSSGTLTFQGVMYRQRPLRRRHSLRPAGGLHHRRCQPVVRGDGAF